MSCKKEFVIEIKISSVWSDQAKQNEQIVRVKLVEWAHLLPQLAVGGAQVGQDATPGSQHSARIRLGLEHLLRRFVQRRLEAVEEQWAKPCM